jgi:hypothetical protein
MYQAESEASQTSVAVPEWVYPYRAGVVGGALGGLAMIGVAGLYGLLTGVGLWLPVNLIGATLVRSLQDIPLERLAQFNLEALVIGLILHAFLSITLGLIFAALLPTLPGSPVVWSIVIGPLLWTIASVMILPMINPAMAQHVDHFSFFVAHAVYSVVLGLQIARTPKVRA